MHIPLFKIFKTSMCVCIVSYVLYLAVYGVSTWSSKAMFTVFLFILSLLLLLFEEDGVQNLKSAYESKQI